MKAKIRVHGKSQSRTVLGILLLLLLLLMFFLCWKKCSSNRSHTDVSDVYTVVETVKRLSNPISYYGNSKSITLPDGNFFNISHQNSSEYKLFAFLNNPDAQVDADRTKGWIPMDDIHFEKGIAILLPESENQLKNIALILQSFPNSRIKIGGYTDDTGTDEINMRLSFERAKVVFKKLVSLDVAAHRIAYEGYGSNYPNDSDEAIAANRRVDIRITQK